jgi:hypothetical protein
MSRFAALLVMVSSPWSLWAEEMVPFAAIRPILTNACFKCHGPDLKKGGLDLQTFESATAEAKSGLRAIVPKNHSKSEMLRRLRLPADDSEHMPPKGQLSKAQMDLLAKWIDQGATFAEHWAFVPPKKTIPDPGAQAIDRLVDRTLSARGLKRSQRATAETLIRRVSLDLTGLPPTIEQTRSFLADATPQAYGKLVDRLLASPHFGEQMAKMWLDLARYADTNGYEKDDRRSIWPYRDWVIRAFNSDMPYDQFTREQIAGDLLPNPSTSQLVATGFHRNTMTNTEGGTDDEEFRVAAVVDRVNTTMEVWTGLTFACAQCHSHKYDPISQKDYYRLFAFFNSTTDGGRSTAPDLPLPTEEQSLRQREIAASRATIGRIGGLLPPIAAQAILQRLKKQEDSLTVARTLVLRERPSPRETHIMLRGEFKNRGEKVAPGYPAKLGGGEGSNRLALAEWLVNAQNPLAGRVMANRLWAKLFGRGLVETIEDFGIMGDLPTHPELLDWLAVEFTEHGWSIKALLKTIVMSETYRQSAVITPDRLANDPDNRWLSRGPRFRLDAEAVRDQALTVSGLLKRDIGGPSVMPYQPDGVWANPYSGDKWTAGQNGDQYRRSLYTFWRRTAPFAMFTTFDAPSREVACSRRPRTNTPLQALATLNDRGLWDCAEGLADRMMNEGGKTVNDQIEFAYQVVLARLPNDREREVVRHLLEVNRWRYAFNPEAAAKIGKSRSFEKAARTVVANVVLNLDETVTKP